MRFSTFILILCLAIAPITGFAMEIDGNQLWIFCAQDNKNSEEVGVCKGILIAVVSSFDSWPYCEIEIEGGKKILAPFCDGDCQTPITLNRPNDIALSQVRNIVIKYLIANPGDAQFPAYWIARQALHDAFGIKEQ